MKYFAASLAFFLLAAAADPAVAQYRGRDEGGQLQSLDRILDTIRRSRPGQLSDVQGPFNGYYRIKWLTPDGRVLWLETDARTGQVVGVEGDDQPGRGGGQGGFRNRDFRNRDFGGRDGDRFYRGGGLPFGFGR